FQQYSHNLMELANQLPQPTHSSTFSSPLLIHRLIQTLELSVTHQPDWLDRQHQLSTSLIHLFKWLDHMSLYDKPSKDRGLDEMTHFHIAKQHLLSYFLNFHSKWGF